MIRHVVIGSAFLLGLSHAARAEWSLRLEPISVPALDLEQKDPIVAVDIAPLPTGDGLLAVRDGDLALYRIPWHGPATAIQRPTSLDGDHPRLLGVQGGQLLLGGRRGPLEVVDRDLKPLRPVPSWLRGDSPSALVGDRLFRMEPPTVAPPGEAPRWNDPAWRRGHRRDDCGLYAMSLDDDTPQPSPLVCDTKLDSPNARVRRGGAILSSIDGKQLYAVLGARPFLTILEPDGGTSRDVTYLEPGETFVEFSAAEERYQYTSSEAALALRNRVPWFYGLLRWPGHIGLIFRISDGTQTRFVVDLFDAAGQKLANDLPLSSVEHDHRIHIQPVHLTDGQSLLLIQKRDPSARLVSQTLHRVKLHRKASPSSSNTGDAGPALRFDLVDLENLAPVTSARFVLRAGKRTSMPEQANPRGAYALRFAGHGTAPLTIEADGYLPTSLDVPLATDADLGTILLDPGAKVHGSLLDADSGEALEGVQFTHIRRHPWGALAADFYRFHNTASSDAHGRFLLSGLPAGPACIRVAQPGSADGALLIAALHAGESRDMGPLLLGGAQRLTGSVMVADDEPLEAGARVELRSGSARNPCQRHQAEIADDGRFTFSAVLPGRYFQTVLMDGQIVAVEPVIVESGTERLAPIRVQRRRFSGRVSVAGQPLAEGVITLRADGAEGFAPPPVFVSGPGGRQRTISDMPTMATAFSDLEGLFATWGYLAPGDSVVMLQAPDGATYRDRFVVPSSPDQPVELMLAFDGANLEGQVIDPQGSAVADATVDLLDGPLAIRTVATNASGHFVIPHVPPGPFRLRAAAAERVAEQALVIDSTAPTATVVVLEPNSASTLAVAIDSADGTPLRVNVLLTDGHSLSRLQAGTTGTTFVGLLPGRYRVIAFADNGILASKPVDLAPRQHARVALSTRHLAPVEVIFPEEAAGERVRLSTDDGFGTDPLLGYLGRTIEVDLDGHADVPSLMPGTWILEIFERDRWQQHRLRVHRRGGTLDLRDDPATPTAP